MPAGRCRGRCDRLPECRRGVKKLMWLDCSANWVRFSYPDSIRYYVNKLPGEPA